MDEIPIKQEIPDPVPLVGNMKNKLSSLLKLGPLETKTTTTTTTLIKKENPDTAPILSLTLLGRKNMFKNKIEPMTTTTTPTNAKIMKMDDIPNSVIKPILNISKLKENLNRRINIAAGVDLKSEPDDDDDMPLKTLKRKLSENAKMQTVASSATPIKLDIFNLKNKLGTALKVGEMLQEKQKIERKPKKHGFIVDINNIIADKKNNIYYCKYCYKYFQNVVALRYHVVLHGKPKKQKTPKKTVEVVETTVKKVDKQKPTTTQQRTQRTQNTQRTEEPAPEKNGKKQTQCDICEKWFINVLMHKARAHKNTK